MLWDFTPFSPADDYYLISIPLFDEVQINAGDEPLLIRKENNGTKITGILLNGEIINDFNLMHHTLKSGGLLKIQTEYE